MYRYDDRNDFYDDYDDNRDDYYRRQPIRYPYPQRPYDGGYPYTPYYPYGRQPYGLQPYGSPRTPRYGYGPRTPGYSPYCPYR